MLHPVLLAALLIFTGLTLLRSIFVALVERRLAQIWGRPTQRGQTIAVTLLGILGILLGLAMLAQQAQAAEQGYSIDLAPALGPLGEALITALSLGAAYLVRRLLAYLGLKEDAQARELLETAFFNGLSAALERALRDNLDTAKVETRHKLVAEGARYVLDAVPDALARFKLDENGVRERLTARLATVTPLPNAPQAVGFLASPP